MHEKMPNKKFTFKLVGTSIVIILISLMAYRYLSTRLTTSNIQPKPVVAFKSPLATKAINTSAKMSSNDYATVSYVTTPNEDVARQLSRKLVENRLAACVNIVKNVESIYEWKGNIEQDTEVLLVIKSQSHKSQDLVNFVQANHPYDCPEVVTLKVDSGSKPYLDWIQQTVGKEPSNAPK